MFGASIYDWASRGFAPCCSWSYGVTGQNGFQRLAVAERMPCRIVDWGISGVNRHSTYALFFQVKDMKSRRFLLETSSACQSFDFLSYRAVMSFVTKQASRMSVHFTSILVEREVINTPGASGDAVSRDALPRLFYPLPFFSPTVLWARQEPHWDRGMG